MLSINTNLSSLIVQNSLKQSTNRLNTAIERLTTGFKINHAKDNAANYNIATNMTTQIGSLDVAEDNVNTGIDMLTTAESSLDLISSKLQRLRDLAVQTSNGTYSEQSKQAINSEANALVDEIQRLHSTTEYNGKKILGDDSVNTCGVNMQPVEFTKRDTTNLKPLGEIEDTTVALTDGTYSISTAEELAQLATMTNAGLISEGDEFVLANDIDLINYTISEGWTPIGTAAIKFSGTFDGNGYTITNLYINRPSTDYQGLFGHSQGDLKNVNISDANITGNTGIGILIGVHNGGKVNNCHSSGIINAFRIAGGLIGQFADEMKNCSSNVKIIARDSGTQIGGLVGNLAKGAIKIDSCYTKNEIIASSKESVGGFCGQNTSSCISIEITNCYAETDIKLLENGNVQGFVGGFIGTSNATVMKISNCYSTGRITSDTISPERYAIAGFCAGLGMSSNTTGIYDISDCYSNVNIDLRGSYVYNVAGFIGQLNLCQIANFKNCYSSGNISINAPKIRNTGGFAGILTSNKTNLTDCYTLSNLYLEDGCSLFDGIGGFLGKALAIAGSVSQKIENCYNRNKIETNLATGVFNIAGGFVGTLEEDSSCDGLLNIKNSYMIIDKDSEISTIWGSRPSGTELKIENSYYNREFANSGLNLFSDENGNAIRDSDLITQVKTCATDEPFKLYFNQQSALQASTGSDTNSRISIDTTCSLKYMNVFRNIGLYEDDYLTKIDELLSDINSKQTQIGASNNRLISAMEEISIRRDNLISSRSTLRDADIADISSEYIRQQILQQASATLLSTANQSPSIALQLI